MSLLCENISGRDRQVRGAGSDSGESQHCCMTGPITGAAGDRDRGGFATGPPLDYPLYWRVKVIRPEWHGRRCRIVIHGGRGNRLIEFDNGDRVVCPGTYLRRAA